VSRRRADEPDPTPDVRECNPSRRASRLRTAAGVREFEIREPGNSQIIGVRCGRIAGHLEPGALSPDGEQ
jgi:hypothetical protein